MGRKYISVYVRNSQNGPSCYYRIIQYIEKMQEFSFKINNGFSKKIFDRNLKLRGKRFYNFFQIYAYVYICCSRLVCFIRDVINKPPIIIIQRETIPRIISPLHVWLLNKMALNSHIIWDFDDNIFTGEISNIERTILEEKSDCIIVTNQYLKDTIDKAYQEKVYILPTTDKTLREHDIKAAIEKRKEIYPEMINCIWIGVPINLYNLQSVLPFLEQAGKKLRQQGKQLILRVLCSKDFEFQSKYVKIENISWSRNAVVNALYDSHFGIMPLNDNEFTRGKGGFKLIQYMSAALPVIASPVGYNNEIINSTFGFLAEGSSWISSIVCLSEDVNKWSEYCVNAYAEYNKHFNYKSGLKLWRNIIGKFLFEGGQR